MGCGRWILRIGFWAWFERDNARLRADVEVQFRVSSFVNLLEFEVSLFGGSVMREDSRIRMDSMLVLWAVKKRNSISTRYLNVRNSFARPMIVTLYRAGERRICMCIPIYLQRENCQSVRQAESHVELHSAGVFAGGTLDVAGMKVCN